MPRATETSIDHSLRDFVKHFGAPALLTFDGAPNQTGDNTLFKKSRRDYNIPYHISSPYHLNKSPSEGMIREITL